MSVRRRSLALLALLVLAALGVADSIYLTRVHLELEFGATKFEGLCHALSKTGCSITGGQYGAIGWLPVSVIGGAGALATAMLASAAFVRRALERDPLRSILFAVAIFAVLASAAMGALSASEGQFCPFCVMWYGINALQLVAAWFALDSRPMNALVTAVRSAFRPAGLGAFAALGASLGISVWLYAGQHAEWIARTPPAPPPKPAVVLHIPDDAPRKRAKHFSAGTPEVILVEFSDFECPFCRQLWDAVSALLEETDRRVEVVYLHFPLDSACNSLLSHPMHPHACLAAMAAECAHRQGKFWEFGERLFANQQALDDEHLLGYAAELGLDVSAFAACLDSDDARARVSNQVKEGQRLNIAGTPTLYANGRMISGAPTKAGLEKALTEILSAVAPTAEAP